MSLRVNKVQRLNQCFLIFNFYFLISNINN